MKKEIKTNCRLCQNNSFNIWGVRDNLTLYQCSNCELVFFFPYPTQEELDAFYNDQYHNKRSYNGEGEVGRLRKEMYKLDILDLEKKISVRGRFLDVGCAEGVFLSMLNHGWERYGIDVSQTAIERASQKENVIAEKKNIAEMENSFFDVVHLRGVFEHLLEPLHFVRQVNLKLKENGYLVLSNTPNINGIIPRLFRGRFKLVLPNEHVNYFSKRSIQILLEKEGFTINAITYPYFNTPYCSFIKDLIQIPVNLITGKTSPPFWGNIFTVYAQKIKELS